MTFLETNYLVDLKGLLKFIFETSSSLAALLFLIYISELPNEVKTSAKLLHVYFYYC